MIHSPGNNAVQQQLQQSNRAMSTDSMKTKFHSPALPDDAVLTKLVQDIVTEQEPTVSISCSGPTCVTLRYGGKLQQRYWRYELDLGQLLDRVIDQAIASLTPSTNSGKSGIDAIELCLTCNYRSIDLADFDQVFANVHRGIRGIELQYQDQCWRYSPTRMIAGNLSFRKVFEQILEQESISAQTFIRKGGMIQVFEAKQVLIRLKPQIKATTMHRGNRVIPLENLSGAVLADLTLGMGQWLMRQVQMDGRIVYKYFPSRGEESSANNLIRQFMATLSLIRYARFTSQEAHRILAKHNLDYNLKQFYRTEETSEGETLGFVEYDGKVKLGAIALAALAILTYSEQADLPDAAFVLPEYQEIFNGLCRTIDHLWQPDGSFRTFYKPGDRNDNQNFYPGEALLFWATLYQHNQDAQLLSRCYTSFHYYQDWHDQHRNPAFIPWHTQAYTLLYQATGDQRFLEFIFAMNDWLLPMQQWDSARYPDVQGRFYHPEHPEYGPPHASSTGVYLEGLADAYQLAVQTGDTHRASQYQQVIWRGLRSIRQLQFRDDIDLFYISKPERVHGGIRTAVYDNVIRVDNVQHCLLAALKLLQLPDFTQPHAGTANLHTPQPTTHNPHPIQPTPPLITEGDQRLHLKQFKLLDAAVDIQPLLAELNTNAQYWLHNTSRQERIKVQRETNSIYLRSAAKPFPPGVTSGNDVHESKTTAIAKQFPVILGWVEQCADRIGGELGRVTIVRLAPQGRVYRHIDHGEYYKQRDRYHLVLQSKEGSILGAGEEWVRMQAGELWWFNNKALHEAYNESDEWRIHLIFDVAYP
jgi:hypothetical protein